KIPVKTSIPQPVFEKSPPPEEKPKAPLPKDSQTRYDTLSRFAAVELEGTLGKD
ncbi:MAG: DNA polymerase III subunit gamma/tau, partial [Verrucomicrobia bacterium]|nr:DNA polymerase III subunit gamma/tau [Verrucomicrobiota bacterium]